MTHLSYPVCKAIDPYITRIVTGIFALSVLFITLACLLVEWGRSDAVVMFAAISMLMPLGALAAGAAWIWFGRREIVVSERGVCARRVLFGMPWKSAFYPAHSLSGFDWKRTFPWKINGREDHRRERCVYNYMLTLHEGQHEVILATSNGEFMQRLGEALAHQWPDRSGSVFSLSAEDAWWRNHGSSALPSANEPRMRRRVACLLWAIGGIFLLFGGFFVAEAWQMASTGVRARAEVVKVECQRPSSERESCAFYVPTLRYADRRGTVHRSVPVTLSSVPLHVGQTVDIYYDPAEPGRVLSANVWSMYVIPGVLMLVGAGLLASGFVFKRTQKIRP